MVESSTAPSMTGACLWHVECGGGEEGRSTLAGSPSPGWEAILVEGNSVDSSHLGCQPSRAIVNSVGSLCLLASCGHQQGRNLWVTRTYFNPGFYDQNEPLAFLPEAFQTASPTGHLLCGNLCQFHMAQSTESSPGGLGEEPGKEEL